METRQESEIFNILVFTQNIKLNSVLKLFNYMNERRCIVLTTHKLFKNEKEIIFQKTNQPIFLTFADFITDEQAEFCDNSAYEKEHFDLNKYYNLIKKYKNEIIIRNLEQQYNLKKKLILCDDLGIHLTTWINNGYKYLKCDYYYEQTKHSFSIKATIKYILKKNRFIMILWNNLKKIIQNKAVHKRITIKQRNFTEEVYLANYNNKKYIFIGRPHRIFYRMNLEFKKDYTERNNLINSNYYTREQAVYLTSIHEGFLPPAKILPNIEFHIIQDGYLPPNYSGRNLMFVPTNVSYYTWDKMGMGIFNHHGIPAQILPFRKKLYMPEPVFPNEVRSVLYVASSSGDWTALKNRSDDDLVLEAIGEIAKKFPNINFVFRCHPTWAHPSHVGVNSINRAIEYYNYLKLPNLKISSNIPQNELGNFVLSFERSFLEDDLKNADIVFGEHSVSMIDAAFEKIPFASINLTNRRNFFCGMTDLGFPMCDSLDKITSLIMEIPTKDFQKNYLKAVFEYNRMTDIV